MWLLYNLFLALNLRAMLLSSFVILLLAFLMKRNPHNYPPGPLALPLVGNLLSIYFIDMKDFHDYLTKLSDLYGNVFRLRLGRDTTVFVTGYKMVKEALVTQGENFVDRPYSPVQNRLYSGDTAGIFFSNGQAWVTQRRFTLNTLRKFGLGKRVLEDIIIEESRYIQENMEREKGEPFDLVPLFNSAIANIITQLVFGKRFDYSDNDFQTILKMTSETVYLEGTIWAHMYDAFPGLMKHLPGPHNAIFSNYKALVAFIGKELERHKLDLDPSNPRDYMDTFIMEIYKNEGSPERAFSDVNLVMCILDMLLAGTETTSTTLQWAMIYLINHPDTQEKVQAEIDRVIGQSRQPNMADKVNMPYTDAVMHEIQRLGNVLPLNGLRMAAKDTTLGGYFIPKGTSLCPYLASVLHDKNEWETPNVFNPEHFLNADGKFVRRDAFLPFSAGKRACIGEGLARMELFLVLVATLQRFSFSTLDGVKLSTEGIFGITRTPYPFKICATPR